MDVPILIPVSGIGTDTSIGTDIWVKYYSRTLKICADTTTPIPLSVSILIPVSAIGTDSGVEYSTHARKMRADTMAPIPAVRVYGYDNLHICVCTAVKRVLEKLGEECCSSNTTLWENKNNKINSILLNVY